MWKSVHLIFYWEKLTLSKNYLFIFESVMLGLKKDLIIKDHLPFWTCQCLHFFCPTSINKSRVNTNALLHSTTQLYIIMDAFINTNYLNFLFNLLILTD